MDNKIGNNGIRVLLHLLFFLSGTAYILAGQLEVDWLRIFKVFPLLMLLLLIYPSKFHPISLKLICGILAGSAGDLVLQYQGSADYFSLGAGFFLIGHVLYNLAMLDLWEIKGEHVLLRRKLAIILGSAAFLSVSDINLSTTVSDKMKQDSILMVIIMPVYLIFLTFNCVNAYLLLLAEKAPDRRHLLLLAGTVMFLISDNLLGRTIFGGFHLYSPKVNSLVIMLTYYLGQYLIVLNVCNIWANQHTKDTHLQGRESLLTNEETLNAIH